MDSTKGAGKTSSMPRVRIPLMEHPIQKKAENPMNKLIPILILLLFASCASATTLHGTVLDADTGDAVGGINVLLSGSTSSAWTDGSGKFDITVPKDTAGQLSFESESPCYYAEVVYNPPSSVEGYYPDTDELWIILNIPSCTSDTDPSTGTDPDHPGPGPGPDDGGKTPSGMTATSTAGWWGAGLIGAVWTTAILALAVIVGAVALPSLAVIGAFALFGALVCMLIFPVITSADIPILSWLTGSAQDAGNAVLNTFGIHFNTIDPKAFGEAAGDGVAEVVKTVTEHVINVFLDAATEATGLSETMIWIIVGAVVVIGLLMWYSQSKQQSMMYTLASMQNSVRSKK